MNRTLSFFTFALILLSCCFVRAQNVRYSVSLPSISSTTTTPYLVANVPPNSLTISVCLSPANQVPCTNYATTYTSSGAACSNGAQDTPDPQPSACQSTADAQGNVGFWLAPGKYAWTACVQNTTTCYGPFTITPAGPQNVNPGVFTNSQPNLYVYSQVGTTNFPGTGLPNETDAFTGITTLPSGATVHQGNGGSFVCYSDAVSSPLGADATCVGVFGVAAALVNNSASYGANFGSSAAAGTSGTLVMGNEVDLGLVSTSAPTRFQGFFLTGAALDGTMPSGPVMGTLNVFSNSASAYGVAFVPGTAQFPVAYWSARGTAPVGVMLDASCYTGACNSQTIQLGGNDGTNAHTASLAADQTGDLLLTPPSGAGVQQPARNFSTFPACSSTTEGMTAAIKDSTTNTWGDTISGSGSDHVLGYCDGTNWTVAAK